MCTEVVRHRVNRAKNGRITNIGSRAPTPKCLRWFSVLCFALVAHAPVALALPAQLGLLKQKSTTPAATVTATASGAAVKEELDSPRASYEYFSRLGSDGEWDKAALYLSLTPEQSKRGAELARRLKLVLDQRLAIVPDSLSPASLGDTTDHSMENDRLGTIVGPSGLPEAVLLTRVDDGGLARWVFSASTVNATDYWFSKLAPSWISNRMPATLMYEGPLHVLWWQWIGLLIAIPLLFLLSLTLSWLARSVFGRIVARTAVDWDDLLVERLRGPFRLWVGAVAAGPVLAILDLNTRVSGLLDATSRGLVLLALFWALLRAIRLGQDHLVSAAWSHGQTQARTLVPLFGNFLRVTLAIFALLVALSQFGYQISSLLAGLGIGGIAVALAAQKTVENMFGQCLACGRQSVSSWRLCARWDAGRNR